MENLHSWKKKLGQREKPLAFLNYNPPPPPPPKSRTSNICYNLEVVGNRTVYAGVFPVDRSQNYVRAYSTLTDIDLQLERIHNAYSRLFYSLITLGFFFPPKRATFFFSPLLLPAGHDYQCLFFILAFYCFVFLSKFNRLNNCYTNKRMTPSLLIFFFLPFLLLRCSSLFR